MNLIEEIRGQTGTLEMNPTMAEFADGMRIKYNTKHLFPVNVVKIANEIGILQCFHHGEIGYDVKTIVSSSENTKPIFIVNDMGKSILILREYTARCIGEYLISVNEPIPEYVTNSFYIGDTPNYVDEFVYHFLMPENEVKNKIKEGYSVTDLSDYFWVSNWFVRERLEQLGI
jgi:hypothetical protein